MKLRRLRRKIPFVGSRLAAPVVPVVKLSGVIGGVGPLRKGLNLVNLDRDLERAFAMDGTGCVALSINSPGGSPVQTALLHQRIRDLAAEHKVEVIAVAEDVAASGGYWLALSADEIFADPSSIVGSIGVISAGFGFTKAIERLGIDRRVYTAGENKSTLDPFRPENPDDVSRLAEIQTEIHESFKAIVRARRGEKITATEEADIFSGAFWTGRKALELGLIDGIGDLRSVLRKRFGPKVQLKYFGDQRPRLLRHFRSAAPATPADWFDSALSTLEVRALWQRFGL